MSDIRIRVGAALDASVQKSFTTLGEAAKRAARDSEKEWRKTERELEQQAKQLLKAREKAERDAEKIVKQADREKIKSAQQVAREGKKAADELARDEKRSVQERERASKALVREVERDARQRVQLERQANREIERDLARSNRDRERSEAGLARAKQKRASDFWGITGGGRIGIGRRAAIGVSAGTAAVYGYGGAALSAGARMLGVDTDMAGMAHQGIENQSTAQQIINAAPSMTATAIPQRMAAAHDVELQAQHVANDTASDTHDVLDAMRKFVALTGDLDTARSTIGEIAKLSRATGSSLEDMSAASAEVANHLGDVPDKAGTTLAVMRAIAGQGKLGALEIRDMAVQMAKLASQAPAFEGETGKTIAVLGALAQESKLRGGSTSAAMAGTSVASFASDITKGTTVKHWTAAGLSAFTDATHTKLRGPEEIILDALKKTKGDLQKLGELFPNKMGFRAVKGFASIYSEAGGGNDGLRAVNAEFRRLEAGLLSTEDVTRAFAAQMSTSEAKVQIFNNHMQQTVEQLQTALIPAFEALSPVIVDVAGKLAHVLGSVLGTERPDAERNAFGTMAGGLNTQSALNRWEEQNVQYFAKPENLTPEQIADRAKTSMANASPMLTAIRQQIDKGSSVEQALAKRVAAEAPADLVDPGSGAVVGKEAESDRYQQDKATLDRLHGTLQDLQSSIDNLLTAITTGKVKVLMPPKPPQADRSGTAPPGTEQ